MQPDDFHRPSRGGSLIIGVFEHLTNVNECVYAAAIIKQGSARVFYLRNRGINSAKVIKRFWQGHKKESKFLSFYSNALIIKSSFL